MQVSLDTQEKMFSFIASVQKSYELGTDFWECIFKNMDELFGYKGVSFFPYSDSSFRMPICGNSHDNAVWNTQLNYWLKQYSHIDPFNPINYSSCIKKRKVVMLRDLLEDFGSCEVMGYSEYRKKHNIKDQMTAQLVTANKLFGCMVVSRAENEESFSENDRRLFEELNIFIENQYNILLKLTQEKMRNQVLYSVINRVDEGVFLLDAQYNLTYANDTGARMVEEITGLQEPECGVWKILSQHILCQNNYSSSITGLLAGYRYQLFPVMLPMVGNGSAVSYMLQMKKPHRAAVCSRESISQYMLTAREIEILEMLLVGDSNQQIADKLVISIHTVKTHVANIFQKMNVTRRMELIKKMERGTVAVS